MDLIILDQIKKDINEEIIMMKMSSALSSLVACEMPRSPSEDQKLLLEEMMAMDDSQNPLLMSQDKIFTIMSDKKPPVHRVSANAIHYQGTRHIPQTPDLRPPDVEYYTKRSQEKRERRARNKERDKQ